MYNIKIEYYDQNIIIINKPIGVLYKDILKINNFCYKIPCRGILNRLDKYTSGIILIARNIKFYYYFKKLILLKLVKKKYFALTEKGGKGFINLSIFKKKNNIKKYCKNSLTYYNIIKIKKNICYLNICIKTGRTHQIRIHLNFTNIKIVNDYYYTKISQNNLHYSKISFFYPLLKNKFLFKCKTSKEMKKRILLNFLK